MDKMGIIPIYFEDNTCPCCGKPQGLKFMEGKKKELTSTPSLPTYGMVCTGCEREFFVKWEPDPDNPGKMKSHPMSRDIIQEFTVSIGEFNKNFSREITFGGLAE